MKKCNICNVIKSKSEFYLSRDRKGRQIVGSRCKPCRKIQETKKRYRTKQQCIDYKGGSCKKCGFDKHPSALEFHHLEPKEKDFDISRLGNRNFSQLKSELDKCLLVCSNCHRMIHANYFLDLSYDNLFILITEQDKYRNSIEETKIPAKEINFCQCGQQICTISKKCRLCCNKSQERINWPSTQKLIQMVDELNYSVVAKILGVSDNAVRKRIKKH